VRVMELLVEDVVTLSGMENKEHMAALNHAGSMS